MLYGPLAGGLDLSDADLQLSGGEDAGDDVAYAGDLDADGFGDIVIGAPQAEYDARSGRGMLYVVGGASL